MHGWIGDFPSSWGEQQQASLGKIFSFHVINTKAQDQFESHGRKEELWANIVRPNMKGMLANGL